MDMSEHVVCPPFMAVSIGKAMFSTIGHTGGYRRLRQKADVKMKEARMLGKTLGIQDWTYRDVYAVIMKIQENHSCTLK